jgi:formyl-CoA transferase
MDHLFEDLLVIDAASFLAGPGASTILGDFGARVIKIEPPQGDGYRLLHGRHRHDFNWSLTSRHKEGMVIDLNQTEGQALLHELVAKADVFVSNFRDDQSRRYAADAATLRALNPRLIYAQFTGFGSVGPDREKRGYDTTAWWASSGILDLMKPREGLPVFPVGGVGDHASAMALFGAIVTALYQREKTGLGDRVETSLIANGAFANGMHLQGAIAGFDLGQILDEKGYQSPFSSVYRTRDDRLVVLVSTTPLKEFPKIARALGCEEWLLDTRFETMKGLMSARAELRDAFTEAFARRTSVELELAFEAEALSFALVERIRDVVRDAQLIENEVIVETTSEDPDFQWTVASPFKLDRQTKRPIADPPKLGEHTIAILKEFGHTDEKIHQWLAQGVIGDRA